MSRLDPSHLAWLRTLACAVPGCQGGAVEAAHVRRGGNGGTALKPSDRRAIPLCAEHHRRQHAIGEAAFERETGIDMGAIAEVLDEASPLRRAA